MSSDESNETLDQVNSVQTEIPTTEQLAEQTGVSLELLQKIETDWPIPPKPENLPIVHEGYPEEERPSKLATLKNPVFLYNTYHPGNGKFVKAVWAYKLTKLGRKKRDLVWQYFRDRKRKAVREKLVELYEAHRIEVMIIYFGDPDQTIFEMDREYCEPLKSSPKPPYTWNHYRLEVKYILKKRRKALEKIMKGEGRTKEEAKPILKTVLTHNKVIYSRTI